MSQMLRDILTGEKEIQKNNLPSAILFSYYTT